MTYMLDQGTHEDGGWDRTEAAVLLLPLVEDYLIYYLGYAVGRILMMGKINITYYDCKIKMVPNKQILLSY